MTQYLAEARSSKGRGSMARSRVGASLRSARERAGWSREALADRSGLSWAAIAQIESGRRQEVRLGTLVALSNAREVSVDYLVGSQATVTPRLLAHRVLIYSSNDDFLSSAGPFLVDGIERADCVLVVTSLWQIALLHDALGDNAANVTFRDSSEWYRTPNDALSNYRGFVQERYEQGAQWIRVIGEPVWAGRSDAEVIDWTRYESMINLALASAPATFMCPYDARSVPDPV